ncbi:MAG: exodeoxyribonuclease VII large subunit [Ignavibacteria bacterium RBG_16_34_14]|nr:MAG: exodeoxyribonuclease VII large subunit [Ignavibacteria bacterium RBG_16_34_14]
MFTPEILTVSELTNQIKQSLEENFSFVSVIGEISNFRQHISGHWYFSIKDSNAVLYCTMWKGFNNFVFFTPQDGMKVVVNGKVTLYPPKGNYQLDVRSMKPSGEGELQAAFELLKQKLSSEGLFNIEHKKPIPRFPEKIGIVTATDSAALKDMISIAQRRYPLAELLIAPAKVQGAGAAESIVHSLRLLNRRDDVDVIIVARGGGSIEDLWAFNEEIVVREIFKSKIPVISGVGHEIDFTIADFAADLRAPTPSAAMEIATPKKEDLISYLENFYESASNSVSDKCVELKRNLIRILSSYGFRLPLDMVRRKSQYLDNLSHKLIRGFDNNIKLRISKVNLLNRIIENNDIQKTLKKGFVLVKQDSKFVTRSTNFNSDNPAVLKFYDDELTVFKKK